MSGPRPSPTRLFSSWSPLILSLLILAPLPSSPYPLTPRAQITVNPGDTYCRPAEWNDILLFFFLNYVTHAFTLKSYPGDGLVYSLPLNFLAMLFPYAGVLKAWDSIRIVQLGQKSDLGRAKTAGALCVVARDDDWRPEGGERVWCWNKAVEKVKGGRVGTWESVLNEASGTAAEAKKRKQERKGKGKERENEMEDMVRSRAHRPMPHFRIKMKDPYQLIPVDPEHVCIHGQVFLPAGYRLITLPRDIPVKPLNTHIADLHLANSHNVPKSLASIVQLFYGAASLYRARSTQFERYGYAAFSLTIIPFMLMSLLNLISHIFTPDFPACYLVRSPIMAEAEARGGLFDGMIGEVDMAALERDDVPASVPGFPVQFRSVDKAESLNTNGSVMAAARVDGAGSVRSTRSTNPQTPITPSTPAAHDFAETRNGNMTINGDTSGDTNGDTNGQTLRVRRSFVVALDPAIVAAETAEAERAKAAAAEAPQNGRRKSERLTPQTVFEALVDLPEAVVRAPQKSDSWLRNLFSGGRRGGSRSNTGFKSFDSWYSGSSRVARQPKIWLSSMGIPPLDEVAPVSFFRKKWSSGTLVGILMLIPYLIIYFTTKFEPKQSTAAQRGWTMAWLSAGQIVGIGMVGVWRDWRNLGRVGGWGALVMVAYAVPAVGGWVVVGQMLREFGVCDVIG